MLREANIIHPIFSLGSILVFLLLFTLALSNNISFLRFLDPEVLDLRIVVIFLLVEPHFAMTIPLLRGYRSFFKTFKVYFVYISTTFQLIHLYYDGFVWKKSNATVREKLTLASL